ncbi:MAG: hypothetical protein J6W76_04235, partial [Spirochaetales bacterium]|nr:hypothetical protein [Spirochaetales bacterium]
MLGAVSFMIGDQRAEIDIFHAAKDVHVNGRTDCTKLPQQELDLLPLGIAAAVFIHLPVLGKSARTLDKRKPVILRPSDDLILPHKIERA